MSGEPLLTCEELIGFLSDYVEGRLPADMRGRFEEHLAVCPACVNYLASYCETMRLAGATRDAAAEAAEDAPEELMRAVLAARRR